MWYRGKDITGECAQCGTTYEKKAYNQLTCSPDCYRQYARAKRITYEPKECIACGQMFTPPRADRLACSPECSKRYAQMFDKERKYEQQRPGRTRRMHLDLTLTAQNALLRCDNGHEHVIGRSQMHLVDTPCMPPWCQAPLDVVQLGWREGVA